MTLSFLRTKTVDVEPGEDLSLWIYWSLTDAWLDVSLRIRIGVPHLEITEIKGEMKRSPHPECQGGLGLLPKVVGVRVGPGLRKIVEGLVGGPAGCRELAEGVLECSNAVIMHFTVPQLRGTEKSTEEERKAKLRALVKMNPRLARSCIAFGEESPLMEGIL